MSEQNYVSARGDTGMLFYVRRVPLEVAHLDSRKVIRQSLKTRDPVLGGLKARQVNDGLEAYWSALLRGEDAKSSWDRYSAAVDLARSFGFTFRPMHELVAGGLTADLAKRLEAAAAVVDNELAFDAIVGATTDPALKLSTLYEAYKGYRTLEHAAMSPRQLRHHEGQRERAIAYAIEAIGDKSLIDITRADVMRFRQWWISKIEREALTVEAPNKSFSNIKGMLTVIDDALQTGYGDVWTKLLLKGTAKTKAKRRLPYSREFIQDQLLRPGALDGMNHEARMIFYILVETGARPSEVCSLRPGQIILDHKIPHIAIVEREDRVLKTEQSIRTIPLVGCALWAARQCAGGFPRYDDNADAFSAAANKFLVQNGLRPSTAHSVYSLRHAFQDRILEAKALDRVQADLMGHAFDRERYGEGASLEAKLEVLEQVKFRWPG